MRCTIISRKIFSSDSKKRNEAPHPKLGLKSEGKLWGEKQSLWFERTMLRAQHRIVRSSKSSACLGVSKPRTKQNPAENYWWFMLTYTGREFILDSDGKVFLHTWEDLFSQIGECTTTLAYLWELWSRSSCKNCILLDSQQEYTFAKSLQCLWSVLVPSRQSRGWLGWRRYFGSSQTGQIDWFLPINWFRTHTHRILSFLRYTLLGQKLLQTLNAI